MPLVNKERILVSLLREISNELGIKLSSFSQDWILRLDKGGLTRHVFGYNFELNSATAELIAGDKAAISDLLANQNIPRVEHKLFLHPRLAGYVSAEGNFASMLAYGSRHGFPLVVKPNQGTGGEDVTRVDNVSELEQAAMALFQVHRAICLSPYLEIEQEYRALMLDEECELLYAKRRPHVVGDGKSSVLELIEKLHLQGLLTQNQAAQAIDQHRGDLKQVPEKRQEIVIGWKHNLGEGSAPLIVESGPLRQDLIKIAKSTQAAINIRFASIDIVQVKGEKFVLEVNSGVMMEYFVSHFEDGRSIAKGVYARAVEKMFAN